MLPGVRQPQPQSQAKPASSPTSTPAATTTPAAPTPTATPAPTPESSFETRPPAPQTTPTPAPAPTATPRPTPTPAPQYGGAEPPAPPPWSFSSSINADRARATREALVKYAGSDEKVAQRISTNLINTLVDGVTVPRTSSINGQEGVLGRRQAMEAARTLATLPQPVYDRVSALLSSAGQVDGAVPAGASAETERALILKAMTARSGPLAGEGPALEQALGELEWFAGAIRGQSRDSVITQTSVIDVDDQANTSTANPLDATATGDTRADNDGYAQRFTTSCAPAVAFMVRGEADPVFAMMLNADGLQNADPSAGASQLERQVLEQDRFFTDQSPEVALTQEQLDEFRRTGALPPGVEHMAGAAVSRIGEKAKKVMDEQLDQLVKAGTITQAQANALQKDARGEALADAERPGRDAALEAVRKGSGDHPSDFELQAMRGDRPKDSFMLVAHALRDLATGVTHQDYWDWPAGHELSPSMLDNMDRALAGGQDLPIRLSTPGQSGGHFMMATDVRTQRGEREFLISDPWSGRTSWVPESELSDSKSDWPRREFNVFWQQVTDVFAPLDFNRQTGQ